MKTKSIVFSWLGILTALLLFLTPVCAQTENVDKATAEAHRKQELERQTYVLLDEIAAGALSLKLPENRAFILAEAADLFWDHDEKRARNLYWDANNQLRLMSASTGNDVQKKKDAFFLSFNLRRELLRKVARRDPQLALDLMRSGQQLPPELGEISLHLPDLEQEIAAEALTRDPQHALQIARQSLARGLTYELFDLLYKLRQLDNELGSVFAGEVISKLETRNIATDLVAGRIAVELLIMSRPPSSAEQSYRRQDKPIKLRPEQRSELAELVANAALGLSTNGNLLYAISDVMPEMEEFARDRVPLLQKKLAAFNETLNKEQKAWQQYNSLVRNATPEQMLAAAQDADDGNQRRMLQQQAVVLAVLRKRADLLREYIGAEIKDDAARDALLDSLNTEQITAAAYPGNAEELRKLLPQIRLKEERARAMAEMAVLLEKKDSHDEALKMLSEAQTLVKKDLGSELQTNALLALMMAYALIEPAKAFAIIEDTVDRANDQISKLLLLDRVISTGVVKKNEIILQNSGVPMNLILLKYRKGIAALANADFDRTKAVADRLTRPELRIMARLMLAQGLLRQNPETSTIGNQ